MRWSLHALKQCVHCKATGAGARPLTIHLPVPSVQESICRLARSGSNVQLVCRSSISLCGMPAAAARGSQTPQEEDLRRR